MKLNTMNLFPILLLACFLAPCRSHQDGAIEGTITPPTEGALITAMQNNKDILKVPADSRDGRFRLGLAAGSYAIMVTVPRSSYPVLLSDIVVKPGAVTSLPPIVLAPQTGTAVLSGKLTPPLPNAEVELLSEGKERAAVRIDREGKYEFRELPAGTYTVRANAPGHANDVMPVIISGNQRVEQNTVLLPISEIEGVDWAAGRIRATGLGLPPAEASNETARREMAKRAALADAQRNLLRIIEQIRINADQDVKTAMRSNKFSARIQGFIKGYTLTSERDLDGGAIEVVLELPLTGPAGLSRYLVE